MEKQKNELDKKVPQGMIKPIGDKFREWLSPMIVVQRPRRGKRICVVFRKLNKFVKIFIHSGASPEKLLWILHCLKNVFNPGLLLIDIGKYLLQKNLNS